MKSLFLNLKMRKSSNDFNRQNSRSRSQATSPSESLKEVNSGMEQELKPPLLGETHKEEFRLRHDAKF